MEAEEHSKEDNAKIEKINKLNEADSMIFQTERHLKEFDEKLSEEDKETLTSALTKLKESHKNEDLEEITTNMDDLNSKWQALSTKLYEQTNSSDEVPSEDGETTDVEFEEVN